MNATLPGVEGARVNRELSSFFTPAWLAERVVLWANVRRGSNVLEPSAGRGALVKPLLSLVGCDVEAWDIDPDNYMALKALFPWAPYDCWARCGDFLAHEYPPGRFTLALMNPPYEGNQDVRFIERALDCSDRVVGIFQSRIVHSKGRAEFWRHHDITRMVILSERPRFGGEHSAKTDFLVMELVRRRHARKQGEATPAQVEWWP